MNNTIIVLDFGSQYTQLIARRLREQGVYTEILPFNAKVEEIKAKKPKGIILSGGPASVYAPDAYFCDEGVFKLKLPILGICYGMQLLAHKFGAEVAPASHKEYGKASLNALKSHPLFTDTPEKQTVWMSHTALKRSRRAKIRLTAYSATKSANFTRCSFIRRCSTASLALKF